MALSLDSLSEIQRDSSLPKTFFLNVFSTFRLRVSYSVQEIHNVAFQISFKVNVLRSFSEPDAEP